MEADVWTERIPFVDLFLSFYLRSGSRPELKDTLHPSLFALTRRRSHLFNLFLPLFLYSPCPSHPVFNSSPLPPHCRWRRRTVENWRLRELNNRPNPSAAVLTARWMTVQHPQCKPLHFFSKCPALPVCPNVQRMPSWGIFLAMNAGLFQTASNVLLSIGPQRKERDRDDGWHNCGSRRSLYKKLKEHMTAVVQWCRLLFTWE